MDGGGKGCIDPGYLVWISSSPDLICLLRICGIDGLIDMGHGLDMHIHYRGMVERYPVAWEAGHGCG